MTTKPDNSWIIHNPKSGSAPESVSRETWVEVIGYLDDVYPPPQRRQVKDVYWGDGADCDNPVHWWRVAEDQSDPDIIYVIEPCPFCNSSAYLSIWNNMHRVECSALFCKTLGPNDLSNLGAIQKWNKTAKTGWKCYHCEEVFTEDQSAKLHFGYGPESLPACIIKAGSEQGLLGALREAERNADDTYMAIQTETLDLFKSYHGTLARHERALTAAEEHGYEKGLADGRKTIDLVIIAARALIERWETPLWKIVPATAEFIHSLKLALDGVASPELVKNHDQIKYGIARGLSFLGGTGTNAEQAKEALFQALAAIEGRERIFTPIPSKDDTKKIVVIADTGPVKIMYGKGRGTTIAKGSSLHLTFKGDFEKKVLINPK